MLQKTKNQLDADTIQDVVLAVISAANSVKLKQAEFYFMPLDETLKECGCRSSQTLYSWIRQGLFPKPHRLVKGGRAVAWRSDLVQEWKESRQHADILEVA